MTRRRGERTTIGATRGWRMVAGAYHQGAMHADYERSHTGPVPRGPTAARLAKPRRTCSVHAPRTRVYAYHLRGMYPRRLIDAVPRK